MLNCMLDTTSPAQMMQEVSTYNPVSSYSTPLEKLLATNFKFQIDKSLESPATEVMFNNSNPVLRNICLKTWLSCENALYSTSNLSNCTTYLLEGLYFNRRFAPDVYLGIAPVLHKDEHSLTCGPLIKEPQLASIQLEQQYVLVMKRLDDSNRLDHQLELSQLANTSGMEFLATTIAEIHQGLERSPQAMGAIELLEAKLDTNLAIFQDALKDLPDKKHDIEQYATMSRLMKDFIHIHAELFRQRFKDKPPRRCHGDLKATNLWVEKDHRRNSQNRNRYHRLFALDCIDFRPDFCHIDTLSDVAMLAVDLEMRLTFTCGWQCGQQLTSHFLSTYLIEAKEGNNVRPLLEYYMTEKAMVGAFMSIQFDKLPTLGEKYLRVARAHAKKLKKYLPPNDDSKELTRKLDCQPLRVVEQIDSSISVLDHILVSGIFAQFFPKMMHALRKDGAAYQPSPGRLHKLSLAALFRML